MRARSKGMVLVGMIAIPLAVHAGISEKEGEGIKKHVLDRYTVNSKLIENEKLAKFSSTRFFEVKVVSRRPGGATSTETLRLLKVGEEFKELDWMGSTKKCEQLMKVFDKKIIIKGEADAKSVEAALDLLYPVGTFDRKHKKIYKDGSTWTFIRGDIFKNLKGFQFTVDEKGRVTAIHYSTGIKKK